MIVVGLTGGIATGKSTVAAMFAARGAAVVDADRVAHRLQAPGALCFRHIVEAFGPDMVGPDGHLDRARLARLVFGDATARRKLEAIMHPAIRQAISEALARAAAEGAPLGVVEAALILEAGQRDRYDYVVVVAAPPDVQLERLRRRGLDEAEARRRLAAQWPTEAKAAAADFVIDNGGDLAATASQVDGVLAALRATGAIPRAAPPEKA